MESHLPIFPAARRSPGRFLSCNDLVDGAVFSALIMKVYETSPLFLLASARNAKLDVGTVDVANGTVAQVITVDETAGIVEEAVGLLLPC